MSSYFLYQNLNIKETEAMTEFLKIEIKNLINLLRTTEEEGFISKLEIPYLLRSLLQFPSQQQIVDEIIPSIEKTEVSDSKNKETCEVEMVIKQVLLILKQNSYPSYDKDYLLKAFKVLDSESKGFIDLHELFYLLTHFGNGFLKENIKEFERFSIENENDLLDDLPIVDDIQKKHDQYTTRKFYYENYIRKIDNDFNVKFKSLMSRFFVFLNEYNRIINKK